MKLYKFQHRSQTIGRPQNDLELKNFVVNMFGVTIPDQQICPTHSTPFRAFADAFFARSQVSVWKASRGFGGKTFLLSLLTLIEAITLAADVTLIGGSGEQSQAAHEHITRLWERPNAPRAMLSGGPTKRETRLINGARIRALMASQTSVRGPHPHRLRADEVDEMTQPILDAALGQPMSTLGVASHIVQSSTHHHPDGVMSTCLRRAREQGYAIHEWCYRESLQPHGWLTQAEVERKRAQLPRVVWENEVELQDPSPESRAIMPQAVARMFNRARGEWSGEARQYIESEPPTSSGQYATGADWAKTHDWTIIITIRYDVYPARVVAFERLGREVYPAMVARFDYQVTRYHSTAWHDGTGLGTVVEDLLHVSAQAITLTGAMRAALLSEYVAAIENGVIESPWIAWMESEHRLASRADLYQTGGKFHLPDSVCAAALAWHGARSGHYNAVVTQADL